MQITHDFLWIAVGKLYVEKLALEADNEALKAANQPQPPAEGVPSEHSVPQAADNS